LRLVKYLARAGVASRRNAELIIRHGRVQINGVLSDLPYTDVGENDLVTVDGKIITGFEKKDYIILNKPSGYISTVSDTHNRPTVTNLLNGVKARLYPVGRLDADTKGVLLMTNDGELAYRLTHPRYQIKKIYHAWVSGIPDERLLKQFERGLIIDGDKTAPASARLLIARTDKNRALLEIILTEGRKRQVKRMCLTIGCPVKSLFRISFAGLTVGDLQEGSFRHLHKEEVEYLYRMVKL